MNTKDVLLLAWLRGACLDGTARQIRETAQLTQAEIASSIGVTDAAVGLWESGKRVPGQDAALRYGRLLDRLQREVPAPT